MTGSGSSFWISGECLVYLGEELTMRLVPHGRSVDSLPARKLGSPTRPLVNHRERLVGDFGQDVGRRLEKSRRFLSQHENAVTRRPIEGKDEVSGRESGIDDEPCLHPEGKVNCRRHVLAGEESKTLECMLPVDLIDQLIRDSERGKRPLAS